MKKAVSVLHPWLAALFPILFLYAKNRDEIGPGEIVIPVVVVLASTAVLLVATNALFRDLRRAGLVTTVVLLLFFSYGHVWDVFGERAVGSFFIGSDIYLLLPYAAFAFAFLAIARAARSLKEITTIFNAVAIVLVAFPAYAIARQGVGSGERPSNCPPALTSSVNGDGTAVSQRRDIYYLIFDRYPSATTLKRRFGGDNAAFVEYLRAKGFYMPQNTRANYPRTAHSLASSLNANLLGCFTRSEGVGSDNYRPIYSALDDHQAGRFLQRLGYRYYHIGSWASFTAKSSIADQNLVYEASQGFSNLLYTTTLARPFGEMLGLSDDFREANAKRVRFQFRSLMDSPRLPGPRFVFAHVLLPHEPYLFTKEGRFVSRQEEAERGLTLGFTEQLRFTNDNIRRVVDLLTSGPVDTQPIIVIQSDEGPHPIRFDIEGDDFDWSRASNDELADTLDIFNAIYMPGVTDPGLYETMTPVNTFRVIFDRYFGADLPLLPDKTYIYRDERHIYDFIDVTGRLSQSSK